MSEHLFGTAPGHLPQRANAIAKRHDACLVNYTDAQCLCGHGCRPYSCRRARRHWFATTNHGEPFNAAVEAAVMTDLRSAGIVE